MKDLIILALYLNVGELSPQKVDHIVSFYWKHFKEEYGTINNIKYHIIPVRDQETKMECIYPEKITPEAENEIIKIYKLLLNGENDQAKEIVRNIERKLKTNKLKNNI